MNPTEIVDLVEELNCELYDKLEGSPFADEIYVSYNSIGWGEIVEFLDVQIWSSENDERGYINEGQPDEDYEPLKPFLIKRINELCKIIGTVELKGEEND